MSDRVLTPALIIFQTEGAHPLSWMLNQFKHVWCIVQEPESGVWVGHNWLNGRVELTYQGMNGYDIFSHYTKHGATVIPVIVDATPKERFFWPLVINSCVGHVKRTLGMTDWSLTPKALHKAVTTKSAPQYLSGHRDPLAAFTLPGGALKGAVKSAVSILPKPGENPLKSLKRGIAPVGRNLKALSQGKLPKPSDALLLPKGALPGADAAQKTLLGG